MADESQAEEAVKAEMGLAALLAVSTTILWLLIIGESRRIE